MLDVQGVVKGYYESHGLFKKKHKAVLKGVSLHVKRGECVGLIGESGSGKSTLGKIILGIEKADEGTISFEGKSEKRAYE